MRSWKASSRKRKLAIVAAALACLLIALRLALPFLLTSVANDAIDRIPDFNGSVEKVDTVLWRGAFRIHGVALDQDGERLSLAAVTIEEIDVSIHWSALFRGEVEGEIIVKRPVVSLQQEEDREQVEDDITWVDTVTDMMPISINHFQIIDGSVTYLRKTEDEVGDLSLESLQFVITNLSNVVDEEEPLPSDFDLTANLFNVMPFNVYGKVNVMQKIPSMSAQLACEGINLPDLNDFAKQFLNLDFRHGTLDLYSEWIIEEAEIAGYLKFLGFNIDVLDVERDDENPLQVVWEAIAGFFVQVVKNQENEQFATRVPFSGSLKSMETDVLASIATLFRNGFVQALDPGVDDTIEFGAKNGSE